MPFLDTITLSTALSLLVLALCAGIVVAGRAEIAVGMYLSTSLWTRSVMIMSIAHTWVLMGTMVGAALVYYMSSNRVNRRFAWIPARDRWIVLWILAWWTLMLVLIVLHEFPEKPQVLRALLLYTIAPLPIVLLFGSDTSRIRWFALGFLLTTIIGAWLSLDVIGITLNDILANPTLTGAGGTLRFGVENYHWFSYMFGIAVLLTLALFLEYRFVVTRLALALTMATCVYFLVLAGSKQSNIATVVSSLLFIAWLTFRRRARMSKLSVYLAAGLASVLGFFLLGAAPTLLFRTSTTDTVGGLFLDAVREGRMPYWQQGFGVFVSSPVWGGAFSDHTISHNLLLGTLADQGLVGFTFLVGFLVFFGRQNSRIWSGSQVDSRAIWRIAFLCIFVFGLVQSMFSGSADSEWHLFWSAGFLWKLRPADSPKNVKLSANEGKWNKARPSLQTTAQSGMRPTVDILKRMDEGGSQ